MRGVNTNDMDVFPEGQVAPQRSLISLFKACENHYCTIFILFAIIYCFTNLGVNNTLLALLIVYGMFVLRSLYCRQIKTLIDIIVSVFVDFLFITIMSISCYTFDGFLPSFDLFFSLGIFLGFYLATSVLFYIIAFISLSNKQNPENDYVQTFWHKITKSHPLADINGKAASKQIRNNTAETISKTQDKTDALKWCENSKYNEKMYLIKGYANALEKGRSYMYTDSTKDDPFQSDIRNHGMGFLLYLAALNKIDYKNNTNPFHSLAELHERFPFWGQYDINNLSTARNRLNEDLGKCGFGNLIRKKGNDKFMLSIPPNMIICDIDLLNQFKAKLPEECDLSQ